MQFLQWRRGLQNVALLKLKRSSTVYPDAIFEVGTLFLLRRSDADFKVETRTSPCWRDAALDCLEDTALNCWETRPLFIWRARLWIVWRMRLWIVWRTQFWIVKRRSSESFGGRGSRLLRDTTLVHLEGTTLDCWKTRLWFTWRVRHWIDEGTKPWIDERTRPWVEERRSPKLLNLLEAMQPSVHRRKRILRRDLELLKTRSSFC